MLLKRSHLSLATDSKTPVFRVCRTPSRRPLAQKSLLAPYTTWTRSGSMISLRLRDSIDAKAGSGGLRFASNTDLAYISLLMRCRSFAAQNRANSRIVSSG